MKQNHFASTHPALEIGKRVAVVLLGACWLAACQSPETHELGYTQDTQELEEEPTEPFSTSPLDFVGRWVGEASDPLALSAGPDGEPPVYEFPSGSTRFTLELSHEMESGGGTLIGKIIFGEGEPPPPATDPDIGYPEGLSYSELLNYGPPLLANDNLVQNHDSSLPPFEGFAYSVHYSNIPLGPPAADGTRTGVPDGVARLVFTTNELLDSWCQLQTPHQTPDREFGPLPYSPFPNRGYSNGLNESCEVPGPDDLSACPDDLDSLPYPDYYNVYFDCAQPGPAVAEVSCDKYFLSQFCACSDVSCSATYPLDFPTINLRASGDELVGVFDNASFKNRRGLATPLGEVRFRRVAN